MAKKQTKKKDELIILDLGCGQNKITLDGIVQHAILTEDKKDKVKVIGVDFYTDDADVKHDLTTFPYPFKDESIDGVFSNHFVEHLDGIERIKFFNELYRICKKEARIRLIHPYYKSSRAVQDPTHKFPPICEESYLYWWKEWRESNKLGHYLGNCDFEFSVFYTFQDNIWATKNEETRNFAIKHYFNIVADMVVDLKKR